MTKEAAMLLTQDFLNSYHIEQEPEDGSLPA